MKISIIHPSRSRINMAQQTVLKWLMRASDKNSLEYILSLDLSDPQLPAYQDVFGSPVKVVVHENTSAIEAINNAAKVAEGDILIVVSDDFDCPNNWDKLLMEAIGDKTDFVAKTNDTLQPWIITLPIMDRAYYNRFGYVYNPEMVHMFADTEMTHVADLLDRKITLPIVFPHNHYATGINKKDAINDKNDATWNQGEAVYLRRVKENFGLIDPPGKLNCGPGHINWLRAKGIHINN